MNPMTLKPGEKMASFQMSDHQGKAWTIPEDLGSKKAAIFFLRHLGCPLCKAKLEELKQALPRFQEKDILLFAVVQSTPRRAENFAAAEAIPFPLIPDREKRLYELFQVKRGGLKEFAAPAAFKAAIKATLKGHLHGRLEGDEFQVPAAFLLSPEGALLFAHYGKDISDFGRVEELLEKA